MSLTARQPTNPPLTIRVVTEDGRDFPDLAWFGLDVTADGLILSVYDLPVARALARGTLCRVTITVVGDAAGRPWDYGRLVVTRSVPASFGPYEAITYRVEMACVPEREG